MKYLIIQNSIKTSGKFVALIDRSVHRDKFWTTTISKAKIFHEKENAILMCNKLSYNSPRVVTFIEARELLRPVKNRKEIENSVMEKNAIEYDMWLKEKHNEEI